jgi:hypothetical protein
MVCSASITFDWASKTLFYPQKPPGTEKTPVVSHLLIEMMNSQDKQQILEEYPKEAQSIHNRNSLRDTKGPSAC